MVSLNLPEYRHVTLLAFVDSEFGISTVTALEQLVAEVRDTRDWVVGPPEFVDDEEGRIRTVGVRLLLLSPSSTAGDPLPVEVDRALLEDVRALTDALAAVSEEYSINIGFEMDGEAVGWIDQGIADDLLSLGLIGAWSSNVKG